MSAGGVVAARSGNHQAGSGATPTSALHSLVLKPIPFSLAKGLMELHHYLRSLPGGTRFVFGVFRLKMLLGVITFGVGPKNVYHLVAGCAPEDCLGLTRLWLSHSLPRNSESYVIGHALRALRKYTRVKFIVTYADPAQGHVGTIYQASNWIYTGLSQATPMYHLGDGRLRHSRTFSHVMGTRNITHLAKQGVDISVVPTLAKHRYLYLLDASLRDSIAVPVLPYPKKENG